MDILYFIKHYSHVLFGLNCLALSILFIFLHHYYGKKISLPFVIVLFQLMISVGVWIWENAYSSNPLGFYLTFMLLSVVISGGVHLLTDLTTEKCSRMICPIFGTVLIAASILHLYRMDYTYFEKEILAGESVPFFLHVLGIDYGIYDYQDLFLFLIVGLLVVYALAYGVFYIFKKHKLAG